MSPSAGSARKTPYTPAAAPAAARVAGFRPAGPAPLVWFFVLIGSLVGVGMAATSMIEHQHGSHHELTRWLH